MRIKAGTIEAFSTGDADILESDLMKKLYALKERVERTGKEQKLDIIVEADE